MKSLKIKFIIFTTLILLATTIFSLFMYNITQNIEYKISEYKMKAVDGKVLILTIEKDLNYISRWNYLKKLNNHHYFLLKEYKK
jgi:hypothetical protein